MSQSYSILFVWSKGASTRRKIFKLLASENRKGNSVYISKLTKMYNSSLENDESSLTNSSIRKNIKVLKKYGFVKAINEGGKPEYLEITKEGKLFLENFK